MNNRDVSKGKSAGAASLQRLDAFCDEFEQAWQGASRPRLENFVARAAECDREDLFRELLALELDYREDLKETASADEYIRRFPGWSEIVTKAFARLGPSTHPVAKEPMISFSCLECGKQYTLKSEFAGRTTTCTGCKKPLVVPTPVQQTVAPELKERITFSCVKCGMKFNTLAEFAGRTTKCPTCKEPVIVPAPEQTVAYVPPTGGLDGTRSSLSQAGMDASVTIALGGSAGQSALKEVLAGDSVGGARYIIDKELARGGMGAVLRAIDCDIRREVAVKFLLNQADANSKLRFVEEAQITGQLEHPNIVPIHELGVDAHKRIFFTMKMVKGRSLGQILKSLTSEVTVAEREYGLSRLLSIVVNVCNALAYAHARGVVHRDLKPANIMVGDFGEVYVMDWGLAKVLDKREAAPDMSPPMAIPVARFASDDKAKTSAEPGATRLTALPVEVPRSVTSYSSGSGKIVTSRDAEADLTQAGAVMGTPVYMPPEQASGAIDTIDERSDIYSMGAILYEMLTLQAPIVKSGGFWEILERVRKGEIERPESKAPERAAAGKIPPELTAVAMKALSLRREDRYSSIVEFQRDVQLFLEGRSVSAKQDTIREMALKLVKRNKGVSVALGAAAAVLLVVGMWSLIAIWSANAQTRAEQAEKLALARRSVPSFIRAARLLISEKQFDDALAQLDTAIGFEENEPDARLLRGQLHLSRLDYAAAKIDMEASLKVQPERAEATNLLELSEKADPKDVTTMLNLAEELARQKAFALSNQLTQRATRLSASREKLLAHYRQKIKGSWPKIHWTLSGTATGDLVLSLGQGTGIRDLAPLQGIPLTNLRLYRESGIHDLSPLQGMPLVMLGLDECPAIRDLTPLKGMSLTSLSLRYCRKIQDITPLREMPLTMLNIADCAQISDFTPLKDMPLTTLDLRNCKINDLTLLKGMRLTSLNLESCTTISDLTPLKGMPLTSLYLARCAKISDLTPLKGIPLTTLDLKNCKINDLTPLQGMLLTSLDLSLCDKISDLMPLRDMPLAYLKLNRCGQFSDLKPLLGLPLTNLDLSDWDKISDLTPLQGMPLTFLSLNKCRRIRDLTSLKDMPLTSLNLRDCDLISDLTPLKGMELKNIYLPPRVTKGMEELRAMKELRINDMPAAEFWKQWDAKTSK